MRLTGPKRTFAAQRKVPAVRQISRAFDLNGLRARSLGSFFIYARK